MKTKVTKSWIMGMALLLMVAGPVAAGQDVNESVNVSTNTRIQHHSLKP